MASFRPEQLARSVDASYEAAAEPSLWRDALRHLNMATGSVGAILHVNAMSGSPVLVGFYGERSSNL